MPRKFYRRRPRKYLRKRTLRKPSRRISKSVKRYVNRAIHRNIEDKEVYAYTALTTMITGTAGVNMYNVGLIIPMSQGVTNSTRIGDSIRIRRGIISGTVHLKTYDASTNPRPMPVYVKMWLVRYLPVQGQVASLSARDTDLFFKGNATALPPQGNLLDMDLDVNRERFRLLGTKQVRLGITGNGTLGPANSASWFDNSAMTARFYFNWGKHTKKMIKISEDSNYASNDNCYLVFQTVYADGQEADGYQISAVSFVNKMGFEDA